MQLSIVKATAKTKNKMREELERTRISHQTAEEGERVRCLNGLLSGRTATTLYGYLLLNETLEKLAEEFPELVVKK